MRNYLVSKIYLKLFFAVGDDRSFTPGKFKTEPALRLLGTRRPGCVSPRTRNHSPVLTLLVREDTHPGVEDRAACLAMTYSPWYAVQLPIQVDHRPSIIVWRKRFPTYSSLYKKGQTFVSPFKLHRKRLSSLVYNMLISILH